MADPFELRLFFSNRLKALNPCEDNTEEVVNFAIKHRELDEDFQSCILEQLENEHNNVNVRANIVYFLEDLVELAKREKHFSYLCMVERDFPKIIDAAIPLDGLGIVNVNCVRYILQVLHSEHGVFCTSENRKAHNTAIRQHADTKTFQQLGEYLDKRAYEARPELMDPDSADESEPDMSWIEHPREAKISAAMEVDTIEGEPRSPNTVAINNGTPALADINMRDLHDIPSPPGSRPLSLASPLKTPVPPTPPSPSPSIEDIPVQQNGKATPSPMQRDQPSAASPMQYTPATFTPANPTPGNSAGASVPSPSAGPTQPAPPPKPTSPEAYTPVQKEDVNVFVPVYFELVTERIEQDRERQRKKEDNSGFVAAATNTDEEVTQVLGNAANGYIGRLTFSALDDEGLWGKAADE